MDATIIAALSATKNAAGERNPEMRHMKKGRAWHFGTSELIGVDADSGPVYTVITAPENQSGVELLDELLHGMEQIVYADAGSTGAQQVRRKNLP